MGNYERKKSTPCAGCMSALKWIPVLFIAAVIVWSYYAYVVQLCILSIENTFEQIVFIIFYHIICILFLWAYWNTIFTPAGSVPGNWRIPEQEIERLFHSDTQEQQKRILENFAKTLPVTNRTLNGSVRFCEKCKIIKPDRAHHCSVCGQCVLKMDHHCPWVNNCVNFSNYKFFVLFLGYALLYCLYVALTSLEYFIRFWRGDLNGGMGRFHILFLFFVSLMFAISLVSLFGYHIYLVLMNRTTLEAFRAPIFRVGGPDKNGYNLGKLANFQEVFGDNWKLWFVPVYTSMGDGLQYTSTKQHQMHSYDSMGDTATTAAAAAMAAAEVTAQTRLEMQPTDKLIATSEAAFDNQHQQQRPLRQHQQENHHHHYQQQQQQQQHKQLPQNSSPSHADKDDSILVLQGDTADDGVDGRGGIISSSDYSGDVVVTIDTASATVASNGNVVIDMQDNAGAPLEYSADIDVHRHDNALNRRT